MHVIRQSLLAGLLITLWSVGRAPSGLAVQGGHTQGTQTGTITEQAALRRLFSATTIQASWFAPQFLAQAPLAALQQLDDQARHVLGSFVAVRPVPYQSYYVTYQQGLIRVTTIELDAQGRILGLQVASPKLAKDRVLVAGYRTYFMCAGTGRPSVILESGLGDDSGVWGSIIPAVAQTTRVCVYDRASLGGSDARPGPRTSTTIARELHTLLQREGIEGPYILAGHSMAGYHMRVFASLYPSEVAGMVMIDVSHPDQVARFLAGLGPQRPDETTDVAAYRHDLMSVNNPEHFDASRSAAQVRAAGVLGALPLVVLTAGTHGLPLTRAKPLETAWRKMQEELAGLSTDSVHVLLPTSSHYVQLDAPKAVIAAIGEVVAAVRAHGSLPACTTIFRRLGGTCVPVL